MTLIVDANVLVAVMNRKDKRHAEMKDYLSSRTDTFIVTPYIVAEVTYLLQKYACWCACRDPVHGDGA